MIVIDIILERYSGCVDTFLVVVTGYAVKQDLVPVAVIDDGDGRVLTSKSVSKWNFLFMLPPAAIMDHKGDGILIVTEAHVQDNVIIVSEQVESGARGGGWLKPGGAEDDDGISLEVRGKLDGGIDRDEVEFSHGELRKDS